MTTQSPLCLEKELRPQEKGIPRLLSQLVSLAPTLLARPLTKENGGLHFWAILSAPVPQSVGGQQLALTRPLLDQTAVSRPAGHRVRQAAAAMRAFGAGCPAAVNFRSGRTAPGQVRTGRAGFASGALLAPPPVTPHSPVLRILGDRMTARGPLRPAKPKTKATCHGGREIRLRRPAGPRAGEAWAGRQVLVSVFCSRSLGDRPSTPPRGSAAWGPRAGSRDLGQRLSGRPR